MGKLFSSLKLSPPCTRLGLAIIALLTASLLCLSDAKAAPTDRHLELDPGRQIEITKPTPAAILREAEPPKNVSRRAPPSNGSPDAITCKRTKIEAETQPYQNRVSQCAASQPSYYLAQTNNNPRDPPASA